MRKIEVMYLVNGVVRHDQFEAESSSITMDADATVVDLLDSEKRNYKTVIYRTAERVAREGL